MNKFCTLIVEDSPDFQDIYRRAVERKAGDAVVVSTYDEAVQAIRRRLHPVAIVDVRLDKADETNMDGLRVLEFIKEIGDATNNVLITGHGTFKIGREAFKKYQVFEGLEKDASLSEIESTISRANRDFEKKFSQEKFSYSPILTESFVPVWEWELRVLRAFSPTGGAEGLYRFLETFLRDLMPLIPHTELPGCQIDQDRKIAAGLFWSRALGRPLVIAFGLKVEVAKVEIGAEPNELKKLFPSFDVGKLGRLVKKAESHGMYGIGRELKGQKFRFFDLVRSTK